MSEIIAYDLIEKSRDLFLGKNIIQALSFNNSHCEHARLSVVRGYEQLI